MREHFYRIEVPTKPVRTGEGEGKPLLLLTHGFADTGASFLRRLPAGLDTRYEILAPNGPFPLPKRTEEGWKEAYGWYFADINAKKIYVHPRVAAGAVSRLVEELGLSGRRKILIGFSQGGYFLPHLARELAGVERLIAVGAGFHPQFFTEFNLPMRVDAVHGTDDEVIPFAEAKGDFERLPEVNRGRFVPVAGMTHTLNEDGRAVIAELL